MDVLVLLQPEADERRIIEEALPGARWAADGECSGRIALTFWPRRELRAAGLQWTDIEGLEVIQVATAGVNHLGWDDVPQGVRVAAAPGSNAGHVAEHVLAFVLEWTRSLRRRTADIRAGRFDVGAPVRSMQGLRVGLVGYGGIGQATAAILAPLGARVRAISRSGRSPAADRIEALGTMDGLAELASWSDVLVICCPLVKDTLHLVDGPVLEALGDGLVVNVARGPIIDEDALYEHLSMRPDAAAALDVWWKYPRDGHPFKRPFHRLDNVTMTPHDAPNVPGFRQEMIAQAARQVARFLETGVLEAEQDRDAHLGVEGDGR